MDTTCRIDQHPRTLVVATKRLTCNRRDCTCSECHKQLSEAEAKDWARE